jgi:YVTN family beta-propeller protein
MSMSNASSAFSLKLSLVLSGARKSLKPSVLHAKSAQKFRAAKFAASAIVLTMLGIQSAAAAPFAYVANYLDSTVSVIDVATGAPVVATAISVGTNPLGVVMNPAGTFVYVSNYGSDSVSVIDTSTNKALATPITVGTQPQLMVISPDGKTLYVANLGGAVSVVDTATNVETTKIQVGNFPVGAALTPDGTTLYVSETSVGKLAIIDTATNAIKSTINVGENPLAVKVSPDGKFAYVINYYSDTVSVIDTVANTVTATIPVDPGPHDIAFNPAGTFAYVTSYLGGVVDVIDTTSNLVVSVIPVGTLDSISTGPLGITVDSNGTFAYVANSAEDDVSVIDLTVNVVTATFATGTTPTYLATTSYANAPSVNLDQRGLTGSWYQPTTSGQGFILEVSPDVNGAGNGFLSAGWFTYDVTAAGGQRWYTLQGSVSNTNSVASLTIGATTAGGNFAAGPVVTAVSVGTAKLQFSDCSHGQLNYTFSDGSNRTGTIPLLRLTPNTTCGITGDNGASAGSYLLSGNWYDPATSGQGFSFDINPATSILSAAWYTYAPSAQGITGVASQRWYSLQTNLFSNGSTSISGVPIIATSGGIFHDPTTATNAKVGTANIQFTSCSAMTLTYNFTSGLNQGLSGTLNLQRTGPAPANCAL